MRVDICIATYRRQASLRRLLEALDVLEEPEGCAIAVLVVDNDSEGSARAVVEAFAEGTRWPVRYEIEPRRNISLARNRAIAGVLEEDADFIAFIDDDEQPESGWVRELLRVQREYQADIVTGPVIPDFDSEVPGWVARGGFFEIPRYATGTAVAMAFTGNALVRREWVERVQCQFDPAYGLTGGGDSHFFMRAHRMGASIVWADAAIVRETIPLSRANAAWILRRAYRVGNCYVWCERSLIPAGEWFPARLAKAWLRIFQGALLLIPAAILGKAHAVGALRRLAHGAGCVAGMIGIRYAEYR